jgi:hypothetical protein
LQEAQFYQNARLFLLTLQEQQDTAATGSGNLTRAFVAQMFNRLALSPLVRERILKCNKVINEQDLWMLHLARVVSQCAGLVKLRGKRFRVTKEGVRLLAESYAGELYRKLFISYFREFNLNYDFFLRDVPGIQQSMAVIFWRLDDVVQDWRSVRNLAPQILLPRVLQKMHEAMVSPYDKEEWILSGYVLEPLREFGLIECKRSEIERWPRITEEDSIRLSPLWKKFIAFRPFMP